jgi:hypothetical protein
MKTRPSPNSVYDEAGETARARGDSSTLERLLAKAEAGE